MHSTPFLAFTGDPQLQYYKYIEYRRDCYAEYPTSLSRFMFYTRIANQQQINVSTFIGSEDGVVCDFDGLRFVRFVRRLIVSVTLKTSWSIEYYTHARNDI